MGEGAADSARSAVEGVRDDPIARLTLLRRLYEVPRGVDRGYLPYRRAATAFMRWQVQRGLLNPPTDPRPGSPWWRTLNESLLRDTAEARALAFGLTGEPSGPGVSAHLDFIRRPTARNWYRAHNISIVEGYLANKALAAQEDRVERFFMNVVLVRVLYAHALVGDPRVGMTGIFLSLSRILPDRYPLGDDVDSYVAVEHGFGRMLDVGVIQPRIGHLYGWSARELGTPALCELLDDNTPAYAWDAADAGIWRFELSRLARAARWAVPVLTHP
jgi:hypothetical protein